VLHRELLEAVRLRQVPPRRVQHDEGLPARIGEDRAHAGLHVGDLGPHRGLVAAQGVRVRGQQGDEGVGHASGQRVHAARREPDVGIVLELGAWLVLEAGGPADFCVYDYDPFTPLDAGNLIDHVIFGGLGARARTVVCGGRVVLRAGRPPDLDLPALSARARDAARAMWGRRST